MLNMNKDEAAIRKICEEILAEHYVSAERMGGLTNRTYHVITDAGRHYSIRLAGEGTEEMINRLDERVSTNLACELGIDAKCLAFHDDGTKVTEYIPGAVTMNSKLFQDLKKIKDAGQIFRILHTSGADTKVPFEVFEIAKTYENIIAKNNVALYDDYDEVRNRIFEIKSEMDARKVGKIVPCHNDPLCENWVVDDSGRMYLIDWEYAGMNDFMWDVADLSIEAEFDREHDEFLLKNYLGTEPTTVDWQHFLASKLYVDYLWTLWAKTRVPFDGQPMEDWAASRYARLKENIKQYENIKENEND